MKQRTALLLAAGLTGFILVFAAVLTVSLSHAPAPAPAPPVPALDTAAPDTTASADAFATREAAYRLALDEARARLEEANRRLAQANAQLAQAGQQAQDNQQPALANQPTASPPTPATAAPVPTAPPAEPAYAVSPDQAARLALAAAPGAQLTGSTPELVDFQGTMAYEVRLDWGNVYVAAGTGQVLYNGAAPPAPAAPSGAAYGDDDDEGDD